MSFFIQLVEATDRVNAGGQAEAGKSDLALGRGELRQRAVGLMEEDDARLRHGASAGFARAAEREVLGASIAAAHDDAADDVLPLDAPRPFDRVAPLAV